MKQKKNREDKIQGKFLLSDLFRTKGGFKSLNLNQIRILDFNCNTRTKNMLVIKIYILLLFSSNVFCLWINNKSNHRFTSTLEKLIRNAPRIFNENRSDSDDERENSDINELANNSGGNSAIVCPSGMLIVSIF